MLVCNLGVGRVVYIAHNGGSPLLQNQPHALDDAELPDGADDGVH